MKHILLQFICFCIIGFSQAQSGKLDPSFGSKGVVRTDMGSSYMYSSQGRQVLVQPGGGIYIVLNNPTSVSKRFSDGSIDSSYGIDGYSRSLSFYDTYAAIQADNKIVIVGTNNNGLFSTARINANGMPDSSFGTNGIQTTAFSGEAHATSVAIQADGKIVVAGTASSEDGTSFALARYTKNGTADNTFNGNGQVVTNFGNVTLANSVYIQADQKILVGGTIEYVQSVSDFAIARYNPDGSLDNSFSTDGKQTTNVGTDNATGFSIAVQPDQRIILAGYASGKENRFAVVRYTTNGSLDNSFNGSGKQTANLGSDMLVGNSVAIASNGTIVVAGYTNNGTDNDYAVARFTANGSPDNTFGNDGVLTTDISTSDDYAGSVAVQNDNKIIVAGYSIINGISTFTVTRYNENGTPDNSFDTDGLLTGDFKQGYTTFNATAVQIDGKIVAAGKTWNGIDYDFAIVRYNSNGSLDRTFSGDGKQVTEFGGTDEATSVAIQPDGKIVAAGNSNSRFSVARYNADGSPDNTFNGTGKLVMPMGFADVCQSIALQTDSKILITGYTYTDVNYDSAFFATARLNSNGSPDNSFSDDGRQLTDFESSPSFGASIAIQKDGKIIVAGRSIQNGQNNFALVRYNTDGSPDISFSQDGKQTSAFGPDGYFGQSVAIQNDGKIVVAGNAENASGSGTLFAVARYLPGGDLDNTFSGDGFQSTNPGTGVNIQRALAINFDGRIAVGGTNNNYVIALFKSDGDLDNGFGDNGIQTSDISVGGSSVQSITFRDNKLYAAGYGQFPGYAGVVARYLLGEEGGPLPVSLLSFKALPQSKSVLLQWQTASEQNLSGFIIEHSQDGNTFTSIGYKTAEGNSGIKVNYSATDAQPFQGANFYRLKMVDADGKFTNSEIVSVTFSGEVFSLRVYPNPATNVVYVSTASAVGTAVLQIIDAGGRKVKEFKTTLSGNAPKAYYVSDLPGGVYNLLIQTTSKTEVKQFIKE